ncbi:hypothetical protein ACFLYW_04090 [Thermodesulfobacteriota bacterium]
MKKSVILLLGVASGENINTELVIISFFADISCCSVASSAMSESLFDCTVFRATV